MDSGSFNATVLARYYLMGEGGSLNAIAYASTGVDFEAMESTVNETIATTVAVSVLPAAPEAPMSADAKHTTWDTC